MTDIESEELWTEVLGIVQEAVIKIIPKKHAKNEKLLSEKPLQIAEKDLQIAEKTKEVKGKGERKDIPT